MKAIIMAGGEGTRLRPLTCNIPKPMMPILDKPVMQYAIELLKQNGITEIGVTLQYLPDEIISYFGDGKEFGVNIRYFIEETPLGTAGSVKNAENFLDETFIVISGDALTDIDVKKAVAFHEEKKSITTLVLKEVPVPLDYGVVITDKDGAVKGFLEKPSWSEVFSDKVNTGIYIMEPEILMYFDKNQKFDFSNDLFPILLNNNRPIYGCVTDGYWCDIGNIEQYMKCQFDILKGEVKVNIKGHKLREGIWIGENCEINMKAVLTPPLYLGDRCKIYSGADIGPYTIIGKNNILSNSTTIKRSIMFDNCYIGNYSQIKGAVLCQRVQIESRVAVYEEAAIGDETLIKERAIIKPGVKIWPNKEVESSTTVKSNIIWGGKFSKSLFGRDGICGEVNVDITPEFVSKLGSAYGSIMKSDSKVAISCSDYGAAQMFKYSLATGLLSMGIEVYDLKRLTTAMARQATMFFGAQAGIHVVVDDENTQKVKILFMDNYGLNIDKCTERKIENSFIREDFRRVKTDSFKHISHFSECIEYYTRNLINQIEVHRIREYKYKVILCIKSPMLRDVVQKILSEVNVIVKLYDGYRDIYGLSNEVLMNEADLGIYITDEAEQAVIVDDMCNIIKDDMFHALSALVILKSTKLKTFVAPVNGSNMLEDVAKMCNANFTRTKTSQNLILDTYIKNEKCMPKKECAKAYLTSLDTVSIFLLTLNLMSELKCSLSKIVGQLPKYYRRKFDVFCPWHLKGKVMRTIIEENDCNSIDLIEGVKLNYKDSWVLVLPDLDEPLCKVYIEAKTQEELEKLSQEYVNKIQLLAIEKEEQSI